MAVVTIGAEQKSLNIARKQTRDGEQIEITIAGSPGSLYWDSNQGSLSSGARATGSERELVERLVLDSPDQFVLSQLRGSNYRTIASKVRPVNAGDRYEGPLWNIVRVSDPATDESKRPQSRWRLYYLNTVTGLIDRIESEVGGQRIVAEISGWTDQNGEKLPNRITWTSQGRKLMEYSLTSFSHADVKGAR
jgi:hypothetical protein